MWLQPLYKEKRNRGEKTENITFRPPIEGAKLQAETNSLLTDKGAKVWQLWITGSNSSSLLSVDVTQVAMALLRSL